MANDSSDPLHHVEKMQQSLQAIVDHLRADIEKINDDKCKAMFETSAEVLLGIIKAFNDYKEKNEPAWS